VLQRFKLIAQAYAALSDEPSRRAYDESRGQQGYRDASQTRRQPWQQQQQQQRQQQWGGSAGAREWHEHMARARGEPRAATETEVRAAFELFARLFGSSSIEEALRRAAAQGRVEEMLHVRPNGQRVLRRITTRVRDGRVVREVEDVVLERPDSAAATPTLDPRTIFASMLAPFAGALLAQVAKGFFRGIGRLLFSVVRRIFGGR
jgi:curved DNA-binding protein CbpA